MANPNPTPQVSARYGAPMGRPDAMVDDGEKLYLTRIRINSGGYDAGGAYWGLGAPLYAYGSGDGDWKYILVCAHTGKPIESAYGESPA